MEGVLSGALSTPCWNRGTGVAGDDNNAVVAVPVGTDVDFAVSIDGATTGVAVCNGLLSVRASRMPSSTLSAVSLIDRAYAFVRSSAESTTLTHVAAASDATRKVLDAILVEIVRVVNATLAVMLYGAHTADLKRLNVRDAADDARLIEA